MPIPAIVFKKEMSVEERKSVLQKMEEWCREHKMTDMKHTILLATIEYAKKNLVSVSYFSSGLTGEYLICQSIFRHADLSDVIFMQHVLNLFEAKNSENIELRNLIQPTALSARDTLAIPLIHQTRSAAGAVGIFSLLTQTKIGLLSAGLTFIFSNEIVNWRINQSLQNKLALEKAGGVIPKIEDGYDDVQQGAIHFAKTGYDHAVKFFKQTVLPAITSEPAEVKQHIP